MQQAIRCGQQQCALRQPCAQAPMLAWEAQRQDRARAKQGWPQILTDLRIVGEHGRALPRDGKAFGELQARGPHTLQRYYQVRSRVNPEP